jgi:Co/Zn/Cd efflux system component
MLTGATPEPLGMVSIAVLALAANVACLWLISRYRDGGVHMKASYIFSANDVIANLGVIAAGALVAWTGSAWPDWIIGVVIGAVVLTGAVRILRLK